MISFVVYHTNLPDESAKIVTDYTSSLDEQEWKAFLPKYEEYISILFKSARLFHPGCRCVILTDQETPFTLEAEIVRMDVDPAQPAYMRLVAQMEYLKQAKTHTIFLDYDMLVQADLSPLFDQDFDIGLTYRNKREHPINGGLMLIPKDRIGKAYTFLEKVKEIYDTVYLDKFRIWGGVQRSLRDAIGVEAFFRRKSDLIRVDDTQVLLLPAEEYNFSTEDDRLMIDYYPTKKILHFKGNRKHEMIPYWETYLHRE